MDRVVDSGSSTDRIVAILTPDGPIENTAPEKPHPSHFQAAGAREPGHRILHPIKSDIYVNTICE